jgi:hypothetical protein
MNWFFELHKTQPVAHAIGALAFVCVLGIAIFLFDEHTDARRSALRLL